MKVSTDGVLLGAWADLNNINSVLDIGTGTGLIALMIAQRCQALIDALEIEKNAYEQAKENINQSPWSSRIKIHHNSLQSFKTLSKYDLIITNPPFFSNSLINLNKGKSQARHDLKLKQEDILNGCHRLLKGTGQLAIILPFVEAQQFIKRAEQQNLYCIRKTYVKPAPNKDPRRLLMEFSWKKKPLFENHLTIENNKRHDYTKEYVELTKEFYLHF